MNSRTSVVVAAATLMLGVCVSIGCGSGFQGSLPGRDGNGNGPTPPSGSPQVTSLSPSSVEAGSPSFTLTVTGVNFQQGETVEFDSYSLSTTYVSSTEMRAQVPATAVARPGGATVIVATTPPSTFNFGAMFTIQVPPLSGNNSFTLSRFSILAKDMVWDPVSQQFYLSVSSTNATNADTITALSPVTGQLGLSQSAGKGPNRLSVTSDGAYLYAGIDGLGTVQRFTLPDLSSDLSIPLGTYADYQNEPYFAMDVKPAPGTAHTIAVVRGVQAITEEGGVVIYDDAVPRPISVPGFIYTGTEIDSIVWSPDGATIYGTELGGGGGTGYNLWALSVDPSGVQIANHYTSEAGAYGDRPLQYDTATGYLYSSMGKVIDRSTGAVVGSFPLSTIQGGLGYSVMVPDGALNIAYFLGQTQFMGGTQQWTLAAFDLTHFNLLGAVAIPDLNDRPLKLMRWGSNGLAFSGSYGVYLIQGDFVTSPAAHSKGAFGSHF